jgi:hypothetical protein
VTDACLASSEAIGESQAGWPSEEPIFVCGLPRSGTTLVDRILSSHRDVTSVGEIGNFIGLTTLSASALNGSPPSTMTALKDAHRLDLSRLAKPSNPSTSAKPPSSKQAHTNSKL